ncbi:32065_t:CDS:2, partial [Racocetra persica]
LYEKAKEEKEWCETLYNTCITNHGDYDHIKKELEKITKEHDDYKRDLKKIKKFPPYLMRQIIEQFEKISRICVGDEGTYNTCQVKRPSESKFWKLFQQERPKYNKLILSDIAIRLVFTSVHTRQIRNLFEIVPLEGISEIAFGLNFYLVRICDKDLAKKTQNDIILADIFVNSENLENPELKDYFDILATYYGEISFCMLPEEDEIDQNIFDIANFALIIVVDYMQGFFKTRRKHTKILPPDLQNYQQQNFRYLTDMLSYYLGEKFLLLAEQSGLPVYISDREIKITYRYNADIKNALDLAQIIIQQLQQGQNEQNEDEILPDQNLPEQDEDIKETQRPDIIKLIDNRNLNQRINNSKLLLNLINDLQKLRISRLNKLCLEQEGYYIDLKNKTKDIITLNNLFDTINNDKVLTAIQISTLLKNLYELNDNLELADDISKLNQTLLIKNRKI